MSRQISKTFPLRLIWALSVLFLVSGCGTMGNWLHNGFKVGPDYCKPAASVADQWIDFNDPKVISDSYDVNNQAWWSVFEDPRINALVDETYQQNLTLRVAGLRVLESESQRAIAVGQLFPQFQEAFGTYQRSQVSRNGNISGANLPVRNFGAWSTGFNAAWELDLWGRYRRLIESADATLDADVEDYDDILVSLVAETTGSYIAVRGFQERLRYAEGNIQTQLRNLQLATDRWNAGAVSKLDVTQALSSLEQTRALVPVLESGLRQANNRLCVLTGIPPRDLIPELGDEDIPRTPSEVVVGVPADLIRRRPDIRRAERDVAAQSALIGVAAADLFPAFTINGSLNWQATNFGDVFRSGSSAGFIGPSFNWNVLNYGRLLNNVRVQDARFQQLAVNYQQVVLDANAEVENAVVAFLKSQDEVEYLTRGAAALTESVSLADTQYRGGLIDFDRVNNLQRELTLLQDQLAVARTDVALSLIRTYRALGGGWQIRLGAQPALPAADVDQDAEQIPFVPPPVPVPDANAQLGESPAGHSIRLIAATR